MLFFETKEKEIPESKKLCPEIVDIKRAVCRHYEIGEANCRSPGGVWKMRRGILPSVFYDGRSERLEKIAEEFNLNNYSSVSNAISRVKTRLRSKKLQRGLWTVN